jgi:hypothetical protein
MKIIKTSKLILIFAVLVVTVTLAGTIHKNAQQNNNAELVNEKELTSYPTQAFSGISVSGFANVTLKKSDSYKVSYLNNTRNKLQFRFENNTLFVTSNNKSETNNVAIVKIEVPHLNRINAEKNSIVFFKNFDIDSLDVNLNNCQLTLDNSNIAYLQNQICNHSKLWLKNSTLGFCQTECSNVSGINAENASIANLSGSFSENSYLWTTGTMQHIDVKLDSTSRFQKYYRGLQK